MESLISVSTSRAFCILVGVKSTPSNLWYNFIELPYHGESTSRLTTLPTKTSTPILGHYLHISTNTIDSWCEHHGIKSMQLILPKCTAIAQTDLKEPLQVAGVAKMLDPSKANSAKITRSENLHVSYILQKAKVDQQRWNQGFSSNNWESNHKVITSFVYCRQIFFFLMFCPTLSHKCCLTLGANKTWRVHKRNQAKQRLLGYEERTASLHFYVFLYFMYFYIFLYSIFFFKMNS